MHTTFVNEFWISLEVFGTIIFAISGAISAVKREFDITGVILIACIVGNGGGTIRDLLIGSPVFWLTHWSYIFISMISGALTFLFMRYVHLARKFILYSDALGLGVFAIVGVEKTLFYGYGSFIAVIMGLITGIGGGLIRDTLCNQKPLVLCQEIYALAATAGAILFVLLPFQWRINFYADLSCVLLVFVIRILAIKFNWNMPTIKNTPDNRG